MHKVGLYIFIWSHFMQITYLKIETGLVFGTGTRWGILQ